MGHTKSLFGMDAGRTGKPTALPLRLSYSPRNLRDDRAAALQRVRSRSRSGLYAGKRARGLGEVLGITIAKVGRGAARSLILEVGAITPAGANANTEGRPRWDAARPANPLTFDSLILAHLAEAGVAAHPGSQLRIPKTCRACRWEPISWCRGNDSTARAAQHPDSRQLL